MISEFTAKRGDPYRVVSLPRTQFLDRYWHYKPGEHVTFLGYTQCGKSTLCYQLLERTAHPGLPSINLIMKPRDKVITAAFKKLHYPLTRTWPPTGSTFRRPDGWGLWPKHTFHPDPDVDNNRLRVAFRSALADSYKRGNRIVNVDEGLGICGELGLSDNCVTIWSRGSAMGCGLWMGTQRPAYIPLWAYNSANHIFLHNDPDQRSRDRYAEIGGIDPEMVKAVTAQIPLYHFLYICRNGRTMCIVEP